MMSIHFSMRYIAKQGNGTVGIIVCESAGE